MPTPACYSFHQLDYAFISNRWKSCIRQARVRWGPSRHRNRRGRTKRLDGKADHALLELKWSWRLRAVNVNPGKDWSSLKNPATASAMQQAFLSLHKESQEDTESAYKALCKQIRQAAANALPNKIFTPCKARVVSDRTKALFDRRSKATTSTSTSELASIQKEIKSSCLKDFQEWVNTNVLQMEAAEAVGDSRKIFRIAKHLSKKGGQPPTNLTSDEDGNLLRAPEDVAATWFSFLKNKFIATKTEEARPPLDVLPNNRNERTC